MESTYELVIDRCDQSNIDMLLSIVHIVITLYCAVVVNSEIGRQWTAIRRTPGSLLQRCLGNCLWRLLWQCRCYSCLQESWHRVNLL